MVFNQDTGLEKETGYNPMMWTKPIEQPKGNQAAAIRGKEMETVGSEAGDLFDQTQHRMLKDAMFNEMEPVRERYQKMWENDLEEVQRGDAQLVPPAKSTNDQSKQDIMLAPYTYAKTSGGNMPDEVKDQFKNRVQAIEGAKASGKVSMFHYYADLDTIAQKYRAMWPGEREFIDQVTNQFTGREIANRRLAAVMSDLNSYANEKQAGLSAGMNFFNNEKVRASLSIIDAGDGSGRNLWDALSTAYYQSGGDKRYLLQASRAANPMLAADGLRQMDKNTLEVDKLRDEERKKAVHGQFSSWVSNITNSAMSAALGAGRGPEDTSKAFQAGKTGIQPEREQQAQALQGLLKAEMAVVSKVTSEFNQAAEPGSSVKNSDIMTTEDLAKEVESVHKVFDTMRKNIYGGEIGLLTVDKVRNDAAVQAMRSELYKNNPWMLASEATSNLPKVLQDKINTNIANAHDVDGTQFAAQMDTLAMKVIGAQGDPSANSNIKADLESARRDGARGRALRDGLVSGFDIAGSKAAPEHVIDSSIDQLTHGAVQGYIDMFSSDRWDPQTGGFIQGKYDLYSRIYNQGFLENAQKRGRLDEVATASVRDLSDTLMKDAYGEFEKVGTNDYQHLMVHWDDVNHHVHVLINPNTNLFVRGAMAFPRKVPQVVQDAERNINMALDVQTRIAKLKGEQNIDEALAHAFIQAGADFSGMPYDNLGGQWLTAWQNARLAKSKLEIDTDEARKDIRGSAGAGATEEEYPAGGGL